MSVLNIYIDDFIGIDPNSGIKGVTLQSVVGQVSSFKGEYNTIKVNMIDTPGGDAEMGTQIYEYLNSTGKFIHTHAIGLVASASSLIYMSGSKRTMDDNAQLMIHNPFFGEVLYADADYLEMLSKDIKTTEKQYEKTYSTVTGLSEKVVSDLMSNETYITADEAFSMGFATEKESSQLKAVAFFNINNNQMKEEEKKNLLDKLASVLGITSESPKVVALDVNTVGGGVIVFEREEGLPEVGDKATYESKPAEGDFLVQEGKVTYTFVSGELTSITDTPEEEESMAIDEEAISALINEALKPMQAKMASLKEENDSLKEEQKENTKILASIKGVVSTSIVDTNKPIASASDVDKKPNLNQF